jgi:U32 family peptidase
MKRPELLLPAGTLKSMRYAFAYGADAVYAGQPRYSLRVRNNEFHILDNVIAAIGEAHEMGKKFLIASNVLPHNNKVKSYIRDLEPVIEAKPDALIMADPGLIMMVKDKWPDTEIHLSVQANTVNYAAVRFWQSMGISRVILSRELSLEEITEIRQACPDIELETFVHGALCMAYSGRCLLSGYINHRDANQGACTNACRWKYQLHEAKEDDWGNVDPVQQTADIQEKSFLLQEASRPDQLTPIYQDESGTYIMNSKDLRAIQHVKRLMDIGIDCIKIEGRTKTHFYVARTAQLYRQAIEDAMNNKPFDTSLMDDIEGLSSRGYTEGFYRRHVRDELQQYEDRTTSDAVSQFVGEVQDFDTEKGILTVDVKNRFVIGDQLELMTPLGNHKFTLTHIENEKGETVDAAPGSGHIVKIPFESKDPVAFGLLIKHKVPPATKK